MCRLLQSTAYINELFPVIRDLDFDLQIAQGQ